MTIAGLGSGMKATISDGTNTYSPIISIGSAGGTTSVTDLGSASSPSECADFLPGIIDAGFFTFVLRMGSTLGAAADANLTTLHAFWLARTVSTWTLTIPGDATIAVTGFIVHVGVRGHYKGGVQTTVRVKCSGIPAYTAAS